MVGSARAAGTAAVVGGALWALTPLRQPVFGAGRTAAEGVAFFRGYNLLLVLIAVALTVAALHVRRRADRAPDSRAGLGRSGTLGWWTVVTGHGLLAAGSVPAMLFGADLPALVTAGQDVGFVGAMLAALGAVPLGLALRAGRVIPVAAAWLLVATLPLGLPATVVLGATGVPEDYLGLPLTVLYGAAWVWTGAAWLREAAPQPAVVRQRP